MDILIQACQLILSLSILVILHELGHFIPAKIFKTRVEKFYLFFDPWFSVFKKRFGETEYGVGWLPLGGYVKISGMIDESMDKEQMKKPAEPWEFRSKPAWQRVIIMLGGVLVNLFLGFFIYSLLLFTYGDHYLENKNVVNGVLCSDFAKEVGFENGDKILLIDGEEQHRFLEINENMLLRDNGFVVTIERGGRVVDVEIGKNFIKHWKDNGKELLFSPIQTVAVGGFLENSSIRDSGAKKGDVFVSVNGVKTNYFHQVVNELKKNSSKTVRIEVLRDGRLLSFNVRVSENGTVGFSNDSGLEYSFERFNIVSCFPAGYQKAKRVLGSYISQFMLIFNSENDLSGELGGFGTIGGLFPSVWSWQTFWSLTAFLSLMLAFMNLLPIPALDGGHVMFLLYEIIAGKPAPEKFMEYAQMTGIVLLLSLLIFANGNDLLKLF